MIIGLTGKMRAGKNTVADRLKVISDLPVVEVSFAAKLKQSAAAALGCTVEDLERWKNDTRVMVDAVLELEDGVFIPVVPPSNVREYLQHYGTEAHRDVFGEDFWLDAALPLTYSGGYDDALYVVTDIRFQNEATRVLDLSGEVIRVVGPEEETGDHPSEQVVDCHLSIDNTVRDDGFESLDAQLEALLEFLDVRVASG